MHRVLSDIVENTYAIKNRSQVLHIPREEIMYVKSHNSQCILHQVGQKTYTLYKKLGEIEQELTAPVFSAVPPELPCEYELRQSCG